MVIGANTRKNSKLAGTAAGQGHEVTQHYDLSPALVSANSLYLDNYANILSQIDATATRI